MSTWVLASLGALAVVASLLAYAPTTTGWRSRHGQPRTSGTFKSAHQNSPTLPLDEGLVPLLCDSLAALLESGLSVEDALEALGQEHSPEPRLGAVGRRLRWGSGWADAWTSAPGCERISESLRLSVATGAPAVTLLKDAAREARKAKVRAEEAEAAAITVRLVLPLGLCALPAFICLGVVPIALALLPWGP